MPEIEKSKIIREQLKQAQVSPLRTYKDLTVGPAGWMSLLSYELRTFLAGSLSGGLGFLLRKKLYPRMFDSVGRGFICGRNVTIRRPARIALGDNVTIDDLCVVDGRGGENGIALDDGVIINRNTMVLAKSGSIHLGENTSIGANSVLVSMDGLTFGRSVLVAGGCYFSAGAYHTSDTEAAVMDQGAYSGGPIVVGDNVWVGTGAIVLDNVNIGKNAVIGAGAVVTKDIPENAIVAGVPAKVVRTRE